MYSVAVVGKIRSQVESVFTYCRLNMHSPTPQKD